MKIWKSIATMSIAVAAILGMATPSMAAQAPASDAPTLSATASVPEQLQVPDVAPDQNSIARPNYTAGGIYFVCVLPTGGTLTVLAGQKTVTQCAGASAIQMFYESGQFIQTVQLTTAGKTATAEFNNTKSCYLALAGDVALILTSPVDATLFITAPIAAAATADSCITT